LSLQSNPGSEVDTTEISVRARKVVEVLTREFPSRNGLYAGNLSRAAEFIEKEFSSLGMEIESQVYGTYSTRVKNLIVEKRGRNTAKPLIIIGAHYDTAVDTPGADDNASGVAGLLELARLLREYPNERTIQFVAFTLEEPPYFNTAKMGSHVYAKRLKVDRTSVQLMISLEMIGYGGEHLKQSYPFPLMRTLGRYPRVGDFIGIVGNIRTRRLVGAVKAAMREGCKIGVESLSAPGFIPPLYLSDHSSFWKQQYPAIMITDTAFLRNPNYHNQGDTDQTLNYEFLAEVVKGVSRAVIALDQRH
jgi:Zn-dependent M28 family amino/carboxypeptidase